MQTTANRSQKVRNVHVGSHISNYTPAERRVLHRQRTKKLRQLNEMELRRAVDAFLGAQDEEDAAEELETLEIA